MTDTLSRIAAKGNVLRCFVIALGEREATTNYPPSSWSKRYNPPPWSWQIGKQAVCEMMTNSILPKRVILDVDTGIDDALALIVAQYLNDRLQLVGVTTVAGNVDLAATTLNTRAVLGLLRRDDLGVAVGAASPLIRALRPAPGIHGERGLGNVDVLSWRFPFAPVATESAAAFISRVARENPGRLTIIATAPLTNIALALKMDPALAARLAEIVIMGGAIDVAGNASPVAEANFLNDPESAEIVLNSGVPIVLVPLDVTQQVTVTRSHLDGLRSQAQQKPSPVADFAVDILGFYLDASERHGHEGASMHDPLAVLLTVQPDLGEATPLAVQIATGSTIAAGECIVDRRAHSPARAVPRPNVRCYRRVDVQSCRDVILDSLLRTFGQIP